MRICINYCKNCGVQYKWQASGNNWNVDHLQEYNDMVYCPECKKIIIDALSTVEKKTFIKWIKTDLVDLETLKKWEQDHIKEHKLCVGDIGIFPRAKRIFGELYNHETGDSTRTIHINGRGEHSEKFFHCSYWEKTDEIYSMTVKVRIDKEENILKYEQD